MFSFAVLTVCVAVAFADVEWTKPSFCKSLDCPVFDTLESGNGYEVRRYQPGKWVSTVYSARSSEEADTLNSIAFHKLFNYTHGGNERGEKIAMTAPVMTKVQPSDSPLGATVLTRSFYLPYTSQEDAPKPSSNDVFLQDVPEHTVYVRGFSGFASAEDYRDQVIALAENVADSSSYVADHYFTAGYDSPYMPINRHNEVMLSLKPAN